MTTPDQRTVRALDRSRSNAAGTHADRRTRRQRDRGAQRRAAIREQVR